MFDLDEERSDSDSGNEDEDEDPIPVVKVDVNGDPLLPPIGSRRSKARQDVVREIFRKAYSLYSQSHNLCSTDPEI